MVEPIRKVCVIGAGAMGAQIAAQVANAGIPVLLLDIVPAEASDRDALAAGAVARLRKPESTAFMSGAAAALVATGNVEDDLARIAECDWIVEAVIERLDIKQALYARIEQHKRPGAAVSSNTSTIPLARLTEGRSEQFRRDFLITHFFNPPRYMRLMEIVASPETDPALVDRVEAFVDRAMGKHVVRCKDTPGFIANRIGTYWVATSLNAAIDQGISVEEADQIGGKPMGVPATGIFGLIDLVGVDLLPLLTASLGMTLPEGDAYRETIRPQPLLERMIAQGFTGRKGKGGFYRLEKGPDGRRSKLVIDLASGDYRPEQRPARLPAGADRDLNALLDAPGKVGAFAWSVLGPVLSYAASLAGVIADDIVAIDDAVKLGFNWKHGPFELIDRIGASRFADRLRAAGRPVPAILEQVGGGTFYRSEDGRRQYLTPHGGYADVERPAGVLSLADIKLRSRPLIENGAAALWDIGDGAVVLELTTMLNTLSEPVMEFIEQAIALVERDYKALILYSDAADFSAGADLARAREAIAAQAWSEIERSVACGQKAFKALKYAPFPVVAATAGRALGGGCEIVLHADVIQAHAETYIGLVECGVGLIPGWGGCGEMLDRIARAPGLAEGALAPIARAFELILQARVSKSAADAREMTILRPSDGISMNRDRLLADAKAMALSLAQSYAPPAAPVFRVPGGSGRVALGAAVEALHQQGLATDYDQVVGARLAWVLTGGDMDQAVTVSEADLLALERNALVECARDPRTAARIEHMLDTGKPLRN